MNEATLARVLRKLQPFKIELGGDWYAKYVWDEPHVETSPITTSPGDPCYVDIDIPAGYAWRILAAELTNFTRAGCYGGLQVNAKGKYPITLIAELMHDTGPVPVASCSITWYGVSYSIGQFGAQMYGTVVGDAVRCTVLKQSARL